jgi:hypothetical protein
VSTHYRTTPSLASTTLERRGAKPKPVEAPVRQDVREVVTDYVGAGRDRTKAAERRALTAIERMHVAGSITFEEFTCAGRLRNQVMLELGRSEGVASYGNAERASEPWRRGDAKALAAMRNRPNRNKLADFLFAMCGVEDESGRRTVDIELATLVIRATIEVTDPIQLGQIGQQRTTYAGEKQKQAAGSAVLRECLRRGAAYLGYVKQVGADQWHRAISPSMVR